MLLADNTSNQPYVATAFQIVQQQYLSEKPMNSKAVTDFNEDELERLLAELHLEDQGISTMISEHEVTVRHNQLAVQRNVEQNSISDTGQSRHQVIRAQVEADLDRIYGKDVVEVQEVVTGLPETNNCVSEVRVLRNGDVGHTNMAVIVNDWSEGVWEAPKRMIGVEVYRQLPEDLKDALIANSSYIHEFTQHQADAGISRPAIKIVDKSLIEWLAIVDRETPDFAKLEIESRNGRESMEAVRRYLFEDERHTPGGLNTVVAEEFESLGYTVAYNRLDGVLLFAMKSGSVRWTAV